jgi:hypothetical protein
MHGLRLRVKGLGLRVQGLVFSVEHLGLEFYESGFRT